MRKPVYFDHHATTPVDPRVLEAMLPYFGPKFGNAASRTHRFGWEAEKAVEKARQQVAALIGAEPRDRIEQPGAQGSAGGLASRTAHRDGGDRASRSARRRETSGAAGGHFDD